MKTIIKDKSRIRQVLEKLEQQQLEREFKSKNISDLVKKLKKHKNEEIRELENENLDSHHPCYKDYKEGYIEGIKKCIDILNLNKSL